MLRVNQVKLRTGHSKQALRKKAAEILKIPMEDITELQIVRRSVDARKKPEIFYSYTLDAAVKREDKILNKFKGKENLVCRPEKLPYCFPSYGKQPQKHPTVVVGTGPAGLFCGYFLALHGYRPVILERGKCVEERRKDVETFWAGGSLNPESNIQFGEGGAGTFSDGKLNTLVKDKDGRNGVVLETFVKFGAEESILYDAKPHIGTDVLCDVVRRMREEIIRLGGRVCFESCVTKICIQQDHVTGVIVNDNERIDCGQLVLAIGHSARDTFYELYEEQIPMEAKAFAVGLRVEHPQSLINKSQYGLENPEGLGPAPYKAAAKAKNGRGVYSFCMCPGGYVVNASSEEGRTAINGMSYSRRDGQNANSAVIVTVTPEDFGSGHPLAGIEFQRKLEEKAYDVGGGKIPMQRYGAFRNRVLRRAEEEADDDNVCPETGTTVSIVDGRTAKTFIGSGACSKDDAADRMLMPQCKGLYQWADVSRILPKECNEAIVDGMEAFGRQIQGFDSPDVCLSGVESRTSSPVRILRDESLQSEIRGLYPCGEGAGYAGGIMSAAMDGIRVAEMIAKSYMPRQV